MSSPGGYEAGTAFVQVLPSFRFFQKRVAAELARVGDVHIDGELDLSTKQAERAVAAMDARVSKVPIVKQVDLESRAYDAKMAALMAKRDEKVLRIDADISAALARIQELERNRGTLKIDVDAEIAKAEAKIRALEAGRDSVIIDVDAHTGKAEAALRRVNEEVNRVRNNNQVDINMGAGDASRAIAIIGGLTVALSVLGQVAPAAAAAVAAVPAALFAAVQGFSVVKAGVSGISDATKALQAVEDEASTGSGKAADKRVGAANRIASAQSSLQRALEGADRSAIQGAKQVQEARGALADAQVSAGRRVEDAERDLMDAQVAARDAQEALTRARKEAVENLEDLNRSVTGAALDEEAAVIAVQRAHERLEAARARGLDGLDMQEVSVAARQAEQALAEVQDRYGDLREEADVANRAGVDGSEEVTSAQRRSQAAAQDVSNAERELAQTREDGARQVAKAQERVAEAQQQASWAATDASRQVADAQRAVAEAAQSAGDVGSSSMDKLALAMSKLSPAGQQFALFLQNRVKPALADIGGAAQATMLPKVEYAFDRMLTLAPIVQKAFAETGDAIGNLALKAADLVTSGPWQADIASIMSRNTRVISSLGDATLSAFDASRSLAVAGGPLVESLAATAEAALDQFNAWIQGKRETGELQAWFAEMSVRIRDFFHDVGALAGGVWDLLAALAPLGRVILDIVTPIVQFVGALAKANPVLTSIVAIAILGGSAFLSFFRAVGQVKQAVSTATGVYDQMKTAVFGTKKATEEATAAAARNATETAGMGAAADRSGGLMGRLRGGLDSVKSAYQSGSSASQQWALKATSAINDVSGNVTGRLLPATLTGTKGLDSFVPATQRAGGGFTAFSTTAQFALSSVAGKVGGTAAALTKGLGGAITGIVGAMGGPLGLAIAGITVGLGMLAASQAEAAQEAAAHKAQIQGLTDALVESTGAVDDSVRKQIRLNLQEKEVADNAKNLGLNLGHMIRAIGEGGDAAQDFEKDLFGVADQLARTRGLSPEMGAELSNLANQIYQTGGKASDFAVSIDALANGYQTSKNATDEQTDAFRKQITEFLDLVGGYKGAKGDFTTAEQGQKDIAAAQRDAASATENHFNQLKKLNDAVLGSINKDLAHRQAQNNLAEAHQRVADVLADESASSQELTAAQLAEEQSMLQVISTAGDLALANSTATTAAGRQKDETIAQATAAADLANKWQGPIPASLQVYLDKLQIAKDGTGQYIVKLDEVPPTVNTDAVFDDTAARAKVEAFGGWIKNYFDALILPAPDFDIKAGADVLVPIPGTQVPAGRALGAIAIPAYAAGGIRTMSNKHAQVVPPNSPRLMGDRMRGNEAFIPINREPQSIAILADAASQMGFGLVPLASGALLAMQDGGVNQAAGAPAASSGGQAALTLDVSTVDGFTAAVQALTTAALVPLAAEVNTSTIPAFATLEDHAGIRAVASVTALAALLPPLRNSFAVTATAIGASWLAMTLSSLTSVNSVSAYLATLRQGIQLTGAVFGSTADLVGTQWARIREYTAAPVRAAISGPYNSGLIPAWNYLDTFFALGRPLQPLAIPFAVGGQVPGVGSGDTVPALLTPGEYVISKPVVKKWGLNNIDAAHMAASRGGFPGLEGMFTGDDRGLYRVGYASGGPVPEALARATQFGRSMHGKPYIWGGGSEAGTDCSGWMSMLARALVDERPYARREWSTSVAAGGNPPPRFTRGIDGAFAIGVNPGVHTAGTLGGTNVESGGAHNYVAFGAPSTGADDSQFPLKFHLAQLGGSFVSGGAGGGSFDLAGFIKDSFNATYQQLAAYQSAWGSNMMAQAGAALTSQAADSIVKYANTSITPQGTSGNVESWRPLVLQALRMLSMPAEWADIALKRLNQESGGNPNAVNLWDSNAQRGDPSKGLFQVIGSTFRAYRDTRAPDNVLDPLANTLASFKYATSRYGSLPAAFNRPGGYDDGGYLPPGYSTVYNGLSRPERVLTDNQWSSMSSLAAQDSGGGDFTGNLYLSSGEFLGAVEGVIDRANTESGRVLARRTR